MRIFRSIFFCSTLLSLLLVLIWPAQASRRPGASRALRLEFPEAQRAAPVRHVALRIEGGNGEGANGLTLLFTREADGTRNLWQATAREVGGDWARVAVESPSWQTTPLTALSAPLWADEALPGVGRTLLCVTNATGTAAGGAFSQIARFDPDTGGFTPLTNERAKHRELALSPDGTKLAFVREVGGLETIYVMPATGGIARRVLDGARHPAWQGNGALLVSGARSTLNGLYRVALPADWNKLRAETLRAELLFPRAGDVAVAPDGLQLCLAPDDKENAAARLILLAADGSNARAVQGTEGARAPHYAPDGATLLFDAPVGNARALWMLPLLKIAPTVQILAAHTLPMTTGAGATPSVEIIGTVFCPEIAVPQVRLEVGRGAQPTQWEELASPKAPLNRERIGVWTPPPGARGEWTLRLSAVADDGESAQTSLTVTLPLPARVGGNMFEASVPSQSSIKITPPGFGGLHSEPPRTSSQPENSKIRTLPNGVKVFSDAGRAPANAGSAQIGTVPLMVPPIGSPPAPPIASAAPPAPLNGTVPTAPLPPLPPPPGSTTVSIARPNPKSPVEVEPVPGILDGAPVRFENQPPPAAPVSVAPPPATPAAPPLTLPPPVRGNTSPPREVARETAREAPRETARALRGGKSGLPLFVSGTPATMNAGESVPVLVSARNSTRQGWEISGRAPVRLLVRWYDANSGVRTQYRIEWLRAAAPPGGNVKLEVALKAPSRAGRFRVSFALVKLPNGQYQPPPATGDAISGAPGTDGVEELAETTYSINVQ